MIEIIDNIAKYFQCQSCGIENTDNNIFRISIGKDNLQMASIHLCQKCINLIHKKTNIH